MTVIKKGSSEAKIEEYIQANNEDDVPENLSEEVKSTLKAGTESGVFFKNKAGLFKVQKPKPARKAAPKKPAAAKKAGGKKRGGKKNNKKKVILIYG